MSPPVRAEILPLSDKLSPNTNKWVKGRAWAEAVPAIKAASIAHASRLEVRMPTASSDSNPAGGGPSLLVSYTYS